MQSGARRIDEAVGMKPIAFLHNGCSMTGLLGIYLLLIHCVSRTPPLMEPTMDSSVLPARDASVGDRTLGDGFHATGDVVGNAAPRPIAPLSLGDVTLRRPTFRWELPDGFDGAEVQLCADRACTRVLETFRAAETSGRPTSPLPANSVVFWRLRGIAGGTIGTETSATWLFHVPPRDNSNAVDTSKNPHVDVNGDGIDDVVVGAYTASPNGRIQAGTVSVFHGSSVGVATMANNVIEGPSEGEQFGCSVAGAGDVNGDGYGDLVVGALSASPGGRTNAGEVSILHGSEMGIKSGPSQVIEGVGERDLFGSSVAGVGDVNRDGYADVMIGATQADPGGRANAGTAAIYLGGPAGTAMVPAVLLEGATSNDRFGSSVAGAGDINADGYNDVIVGAYYTSPGARLQSGSASVFYGNVSAIANTPAFVLEGVANNDQFGSTVSSAGDVNGDGFDDLAIAAVLADPGGRMNAGTVSIYHGGRTPIHDPPAILLTGLTALDAFGTSVASARDVNADGYGDLIVGVVGASAAGASGAGSASVYYGNVMGLRVTADLSLPGMERGDLFGSAVASAGDVNGDGFGDVIVGAVLADPMGIPNAGSATLFYGSAMGLLPLPSATLQGGAVNDQFGASVAWRAIFPLDLHGRLRRKIAMIPRVRHTTGV